MKGICHLILKSVLLLFLLSSSLWAAEPHRVLFISAYHPAFPTFFQQVEGIKSIFDEKPILLDIEFMDTKRFPARETFDSFYQALSLKLSRIRPYETIIVGDDNALSFALKHQSELFQGKPIVFLGVNNIDLALQQNENLYVTGVAEAVSMKETLELMLKLHPGAQRFVALVDGLPSGQGDLKTFFQYEEEFAPVDFSALSLNVLSFEEFAVQLQALGANDVVLLLSAYRDKHGKTLLFGESLELIRANLSRPLYHLWFHGMGQGILGGKLISHRQQGRAAAEMVIEILAGKPVENISVRSESPNSYLFDYQELARFGIERSSLPTDTQIYNEPQSDYQEHKELIWTVVGVFFGYTLLLFGMWLSIQRRKQAEEALRVSEKRQRLLLKNLQVGIVVHATDTRIVMNNPKASDLLGLTEDQMRGRVAIDPAWRFLRGDGTPMPPEEYPVNQVIAKGAPLENYVVGVERPSGKGLIWVLCAGYPVFNQQNRLQQVVTHFIDITVRIQNEQDLLYREAFEALIAGISTRFVELTAAETDQGIDLALKDLGEFAGVDRCYVFLFSDDGLYMDNTHEWCAEGIISQKENLQGVLVNELPWAMEKTLNKQVFYVPSIADLPPEAGAEKEHWQTQGIKSLIAVPILMAGGVIGVLGFDEVRSEKQWGGADITLLQTVGDILGNTIARQQAEEALQKALAKAEQARDKIEAILQSVADGLMFTDMNNRIILLSASAEAILGRKLSEVFLATMDEAIANQSLRKQISVVKDGAIKEAAMELELPAKARELGRIIQAKSSLVRGKDGNKSGVITLLHDVSRERELDRIKSEFISTAAHELRTPLTSVRGYSQFLLSEKDLGNEQQTEFLTIINEKSMVLEKIIDDLLDLSRVESGRVIHVEKDWYDPGTVLTELVGQYQKEFKTHRFGATLPETSVELLVDKGKIIQVMENLLINAVKFSPEGSRILVACEMSATEVHISVKDEGIGMTAEQVDRVFDKFYRVDSSLMAKEGLGQNLGRKQTGQGNDGKFYHSLNFEEQQQ